MRHSRTSQNSSDDLWPSLLSASSSTRYLVSLCVHENVEAGRHLGVDDNAEGEGLGEDVPGHLPPCVHDHVLGQDEPVEALQGEGGLDVKHNILAWKHIEGRREAGQRYMFQQKNGERDRKDAREIE